MRLLAIAGDPSRRSPLTARGFAATHGNRRASDGRHTLLFDGRIDARADLAAALDLGVFEDDATLLLAAWRRWGEDLPARIYGDFAIAITDAETRRATLIRDCAICRPLYYFWCDDFAAFGTELRSVLGWPDVPREIDEAGLADLISANLSTRDTTVWRGVHLVPSGSVVTLDAAGALTRRWWRPEAIPALKLRNDADYVEAARTLIDQATRDRVPASGSIHVAASGGLDSAAVLGALDRIGVASRVRATALMTPPGYDADDGRERAAVAALRAVHPEMRFDIVEPGADMASPAATRSFGLFPSPVVNWEPMAWFAPIYAAAAADRAQTVMTGDFGDLAFSHSGMGLLPQLLRQGRWLRALKESRALSLHSGGAMASLLRTAARQAFVPTRLQLRHAARRPGGVGDWSAYVAVNPDFAQRTDLRRRLEAEGFPGGDHHVVDGVRGALAHFACRLRNATEHEAMRRAATGVVSVDPLADRRLLEFCAAIPADQYLRDGQTRWLARRVVGSDPRLAAVTGQARKIRQHRDWFLSLTAHRQVMQAELATLRRSPLASRVLDLDRLDQLARSWPVDNEAEDHARELRSALRRAVSVGAFLRWTEGGNAPPDG